MRLDLRQMTQRAGWGVADQALSSLTNFAVGIFVAHALPPAAFGAFGLAFATYLFVLNASRGLATDPFVVRFSDVPAASWRSAVAESTAAATTVGLVAGALSVAAALGLHEAANESFLALGVVLPGLMLQDSWRYAFFAAGRGRAAFLNDLVWAVALVPAMLLVSRIEPLHVGWFVLAWGGAATVAGLVGVVQSGVRPRPQAAWRWYQAHHDLGLRYLGENVAFSAATQVRLYGLAGISGLAAVGAVRGAELLLGPVNLIVMGIGGLMAIPEASRLARQAPARLRPFCMVVSTVLFLGAMVWGGVLGLLVDHGFGERLLGRTWPLASDLLLPTTLMVAFLGVWCGAWVGLRGLGAARRSLTAQALGASAFLGCALVGAGIGDADGAAWGSAVGNMLASVVWWYHLQRAIGEAADLAGGTPDDTKAGQAATVGA